MVTQHIDVLKDVVYFEDDEIKLLATIYLPKKKLKHAGVLLIHGGAWQTGSKERLHQWGCFLAEEGYVAVATNYRLSTPHKSIWPTVLGDIQAGYDFLIEHAEEWQIDQERMGIIGASAGAHLASFFALSPPSVANIKAVVGVYGVYDLKSWWQYTQQARDDDPVGKMMAYMR